MTRQDADMDCCPTQTENECPDCGGEGYIDTESPEWYFSHECRTCQGTGLTPPENVDSPSDV